MKTKEGLTEQELYNIGASMCAGSEHCRAEVKAKLLRGTDDEVLCEQVLDRLQADKFIDESRYVRAFVNDKVRFCRWGRKRIAQELWHKQVPESLYKPLLDQIDEKRYLAALRELIRTKRKSVKGANEYECKMKLIRFALGRGFEMNYIRRVVDVEDDSVDYLEEE